MCEDWSAGDSENQETEEGSALSVYESPRIEFTDVGRSSTHLKASIPATIFHLNILPLFRATISISNST